MGRADLFPPGFHSSRHVAADELTNHTPGVFTKTELGKLYEMIEQLDTAMMTTRRPDGHLESRPMANQRSISGADLWFVTSEGTAKLRDLESDPHINLAYYNDRTREWISVSGIATVSRDRQKLRQLYAADWKIWFPDDGDSRHGTPDDPGMVLIGVDVQFAVFLEVQQAAGGCVVRGSERLGDRRHAGDRHTAHCH
jgi:general stress protein 26